VDAAGGSDPTVGDQAATSTEPIDGTRKAAEPSAASASAGTELKEHHLVVPENSKGWSYRRIFGDYVRGCSGIIIKDPYIRAFHQIRNLVEFLRMVNELTPQGDEVTVHLVTGADSDAPEKFEKQMENLNQVKDSFAETATPFSFEFDASPNFHARSITTNHGWKVSLDRGLDIFQWFESSAFNAATNLQEARLTKGCEVSFIRVEKEI
jgi:ATP-dependent Lon protease